MRVICKGLVKEFGRKRAVDGVDLTVEEGDIFGLLGPNGAGKSTMIKMMTGLIWPTAGEVTIGGYDVHSQHRTAMAKVGAIIEWPSFIPYLTARKNLEILSGGRGAAFQRRLMEVVDFVEMVPNLDRGVDTFSTGMKQRLGIALALLPESRFVILDEPTNGLDPNGIVEIRSILRESNRVFGTTILLSSHLLHEVEQVCNRIAIIHYGRIVAAGTIDSLLGSRGILIVRTDDTGKTLALVRDESFRAALELGTITEADGLIRLEGPESSAAPLNARLVNSGIGVRHLSYSRMHLEDFFAEITEGETDVA